MFYVTAFNSSEQESNLYEKSDSEPSTINYLASIRAMNVGFCSGGVISPSFVLTAAECIAKIERKKYSNFTLLTVVISKTEYSIKRVNYHKHFVPRHTLSHKHYNAGLIMVNLLISFNSTIILIINLK